MQRQINISGAFDAFSLQEIDRDFELSNFETFTTAAQQGAIDSFGLGTAVRSLGTDPLAKGDSYYNRSEEEISRMHPRRRGRYSTGPSPRISEDEYKESPNYRPAVKWEPGMTARRAEDLAAWYDASQIRKQQLDKTPGWALELAGSIGGQALDPINYVPILGPSARIAAAAGRLGVVGGRAVIGGADAALNTAIAGALTADTRGAFGDDISFGNLALEVATAAFIGSVFGTVGGAFEAKNIRQRRTALKEINQSHQSLNEAVQSLALDGEISFRPEVSDGISRVAAKNNPALSTKVFQTDTSLDGLIPQRETALSDFEDFIRAEALKNNPELKERFDLAQKEISELEAEIKKAEAPSPEADRLVEIEDSLATTSDNATIKALSEEAQQIEISENARLEKIGKLREQRTALDKANSELFGQVDDFAKHHLERDRDIFAPKTSAPQMPKVMAEALASPLQLKAAEVNAIKPTRSAQEFAEEFGIDAESGDFAELEMFKTLEQQDRLTSDEIADMKKTGEIMERTKHFAAALRQAGICELG